MSTSVSVMRPGDTRSRFVREHFFRSTGLLPGMLRAIIFFILLRIRYVYGRGNKWIVYTLAASSMNYLLKLKMLQYFGFFQLRFCCNYLN